MGPQLYHNTRLPLCGTNTSCNTHQHRVTTQHTSVVSDNTQPYNVTTQHTPLHCRHRDVTHLFTGVVSDKTHSYNVTTQHIPFYFCQGNNTAHTVLLLPVQQLSTHRFTIARQQHSSHHFTVARATTRRTPLYWCCQ